MDSSSVINNTGSNRIMRYLHGLRSNYLKNWVIVTIDLLVSLFCSLLIYIIDTPQAGPISRYEMLWVSVLAIAASTLGFYLLKTYKIIIRYSTIREIWRNAVAMLIKAGLMIGFLKLILNWPLLYLVKFEVFDFAISFIALTFVRASMSYVYDRLNLSVCKDRQRILVYGTDEKSVSLQMRLHKSPHYLPVGYIVYDREYASYRLGNLCIYRFTNREGVSQIVSKMNVSGILFPNYKTVQQEKDRLVRHCGKLKIKIFIAPYIDEFSDQNPVRLKLRPLNIVDLLGRQEIEIDMEAVKKEFRGKTLLVTGAAGSIGSEFCRQAAQLGVIGKLVLVDSAETPMHNLRLELSEQFPSLDFVPIIGDVRNRQRMEYIFDTYRPQVVFHAAAYKHVPLMEENPCEAVRVNVSGTRIVADLAVAYNVNRFIFLSTDKAVNPTNVMGATKRMAEMYVQSMGLAIESGEIKGMTRFVTTRFGNVLASNGSVIPRFTGQIEKGGPVTVTHPEITRYFMSIPEATRLIMEAATLSTDNEIMVFDMGQPVKIQELAERMIEQAGYTPGEDIRIEYTGLRPGEKLYEEVLSTTENSTPTANPLIRVAKIRECRYREVMKGAAALQEKAQTMDIPGTVKLLKKLVPEFISHNSQFEEYDSEDENEKNSKESGT